MNYYDITKMICVICGKETYTKKRRTCSGECLKTAIRNNGSKGGITRLKKLKIRKSNSANTTFIYLLLENETPMYVGKSNNPLKRIGYHLKESKNNKTLKEQWIYSLLQRKQVPELFILDEVKECDWQFFEQYWISVFKTWGFNLLNGTIGGEGSDGFRGRKHSKETLQKCSLAGIRGNIKKKYMRDGAIGSSEGS